MTSFDITPILVGNSKLRTSGVFRPFREEIKKKVSRKNTVFPSELITC